VVKTSSTRKKDRALCTRAAPSVGSLLSCENTMKGGEGMLWLD